MHTICNVNKRYKQNAVPIDVLAFSSVLEKVLVYQTYVYMDV